MKIQVSFFTSSGIGKGRVRPLKTPEIKRFLSKGFLLLSRVIKWAYWLEIGFFVIVSITDENKT